MRIFPRNFDFFKLFDAQAKELINAVKILRSLEKDGDIKRIARKMKEVEHRADEITHEIVRSLNQTFITPIDREDITRLAGNIDDVIDEIDMAICRLNIYHIYPFPKEVFQYGRLSEKAIIDVAKGIEQLRFPKKHEEVLNYCKTINSIEDRTDHLHRRILSRLFSEEKDPITIIKLQEIYSILEHVSDRCEDVANVLETIIIKNL